MNELISEIISKLNKYITEVNVEDRACSMVSTFSPKISENKYFPLIRTKFELDFWFSNHSAIKMVCLGCSKIDYLLFC